MVHRDQLVGSRFKYKTLCVIRSNYLMNIHIVLRGCFLLCSPLIKNNISIYADESEGHRVELDTKKTHQIKYF